MNQTLFFPIAAELDNEHKNDALDLAEKDEVWFIDFQLTWINWLLIDLKKGNDPQNSCFLQVKLHAEIRTGLSMERMSKREHAKWALALVGNGSEQADKKSKKSNKKRFKACFKACFKARNKKSMLF